MTNLSLRFNFIIINTCFVILPQIIFNSLNIIQSNEEMGNLSEEEEKTLLISLRNEFFFRLTISNFIDISILVFLGILYKYKEKKHTGEKYLSSFSQIKGGIYENDGYTALIRSALDWIKKDHAVNGPYRQKKKPVLIVEDLDRLDPKHLFRILNVLSAHIDDTSMPDVVTNKFGFNNIVLVMDYETTEYISIISMEIKHVMRGI